MESEIQHQDSGIATELKSKGHLKMQLVKTHSNCTEEKTWKLWHQTMLLQNSQRGENPISDKLQSWDNVRKQSF